MAFAVEFAPGVRAVLEAKFKEVGWIRPGVMILRQGPRADVRRSDKGQTVWQIERPGSPWMIHLGSFETYPDEELQVVDSIRVHLALIPRDAEKGVTIVLRDGELFCKTLE